MQQLPIVIECPTCGEQYIISRLANNPSEHAVWYSDGYFLDKEIWRTPSIIGCVTCELGFFPENGKRIDVPDWDTFSENGRKQRRPNHQPLDRWPSNCVPERKWISKQNVKSDWNFGMLLTIPNLEDFCYEKTKSSGVFGSKASNYWKGFLMKKVRMTVF
jgi:hypothetical protein